MPRDDAIKHIIRELKKVYASEDFHRDDPFFVLIATVLSQRTNDDVTYPATQRLLKKYRTPAALSNAAVDDIIALIRPVGFYKTKAPRIKEIARILVENYDGKVPGDMEKLLELPGVGRKTANCVLVYGFQIPSIPVDTHVHRISNRLGLVNTKTPEETEKALTAAIPKMYWIELNALFVQFGRDLCRPIKPRCDACPLATLCPYFKDVIEPDTIIKRKKIIVKKESIERKKK